MLRKFLIGVGILFGLLLAVIIIVPLVFDANKYKPQIEKIVEENLNADLELGELKLSLWGGIHFDVSKAILSEKGSHGAKPVFSVEDAKLELPLASILSGHPDITFVMKSPVINVVVEPNGTMNATNLVKPKTAEQVAADQKTAQDKAANPSSGKASTLPFELSFKIVDGKLTYSDLKKNTKTQVNGFDFDLEHFALNKPFKFKFKSDLDVKEMKDLYFKGPIELNGDAGVYMGPQGLDHVDLASVVDLTGVNLRYASLLNKTEKTPLKLDVKLATTPKNLNLEKGHLQIGDAAVDMTGTVNDFNAPILNLKIVSSSFIFEHWQQVLAPLKDFDMKGTASFNIKVMGPVSNMTFAGDAKLQNGNLKAPGIVPRVTDLNADLAFTNATANLSKASLKMGDSDIQLNGTVRNFSAPIINVNMKSQLLDVDALLPQKTAEQEKAATQAEVAKNKNADPAKSEAESEKATMGPIDAMKKNPMARAVDFTAHAQIGKIKVHKAEISNLLAEMTFKNLVLVLRQASAQAFAGKIGFNSTVDFKPVDPAYSVGGDVAGLDVNAAASNQMPSMKDTLFGKMAAKFAVNGSGVTKTKAKQTMKGSGNFRIDNGSWSALKAMQAVGEKLKSIPGADKLAGISVTDKFKVLKSDFTISNGNFNIVNMIADMEGANTGLTGAGHVDFDMNMDLQGKILAPVPQPPPEIRNADGRAAVPYEISCLATAPCLKMDNTISVLAKAYGKKALGDAAKKALEGIDNPTVKDLLKKLPF
jgi:uncharacterized protein involved in outer membrane biogenesis